MFWTCECGETFQKPQTGVQTSYLSLTFRYIECERNLMAQRPAPLNMNKPSSAENSSQVNLSSARTKSFTRKCSQSPASPQSCSQNQLPINKTKYIKKFKKNTMIALSLFLVIIRVAYIFQGYWLNESQGNATEVG